MAKELEEKMNSMTPEELEKYMESIPEWKRGALVVQEGGSADADDEKAVEGIFKRARSKIAQRVNETQFAKDFYEREGENIKNY